MRRSARAVRPIPSAAPTQITTSARSSKAVASASISSILSWRPAAGDLAAAAIEGLSIEVDARARGAGVVADDAEQELGPAAPELDDMTSGRERQRLHESLGMCLVEWRIEDELRRRGVGVEPIRHGRALRGARRRAACSSPSCPGDSRHSQFPPTSPGRFIRASLPSRRTS